LVLPAALLFAATGNAESLRVLPSVDLTETWSDNAALAPAELARPGWITDLVPAIRIDVSGARVKGLFDLRVHNTAYSTDARLNSTQTYLNSFAKVEVAENLLFVDARADVGQQNKSPFGAATTPDLSTPSANRVQTASLQISPYVRGTLSDLASYQLRFTETWVHSDEAALPDTRSSEWIASIRNASPSAKLGWTVAASALSLRNDIVGTLEDSRIRGSIIYAVYPQLRFSLIEGYETTDFEGPPKVGNSTPGIGFTWSPSERTQFSGVYEKRFFGDGYNVIFRHRTPISAWSVLSTKDVEVLPTQLASGGTGALQSLMSEQLTSAIPDPEARAEAVRRRLEETGISGSSPLSSNVVTARPFVYWNSVASAALLGATNTVTFTLTYREQRSFGVSFAGEETSVESDFRQKGLNANWAHKLSPQTSLTLAATALRTDGLTIASRQTKQYSASMFFLTRLGPRTSASLGIRHVNFNSSDELASYRENAAFCLVSIRL
jgi:uncharacterized protein (PEP-CTERM system associated)